MYCFSVSCFLMHKRLVGVEALCVVSLSLVLCPQVKAVTSSSWFLMKNTSSSCKQDGLWYTAIGGQLDCSGSAMMYSAPSGFLNWEYVGLLASQVGSDSTAECQPASNKQGCDQIGGTCRSWECPDFFTVSGLNGRYALKWSDQVSPL